MKLQARKKKSTAEETSFVLKSIEKIPVRKSTTSEVGRESMSSPLAAVQKGLHSREDSPEIYGKEELAFAGVSFTEVNFEPLKAFFQEEAVEVVRLMHEDGDNVMGQLKEDSLLDVVSDSTALLLVPAIRKIIRSHQVVKSTIHHSACSKMIAKFQLDAKGNIHH